MVHHRQGVEGDTAVVGGIGVRVGTTEALKWLTTLKASVHSVFSVCQWFWDGGNMSITDRELKEIRRSLEELG